MWRNSIYSHHSPLSCFYTFPFLFQMKKVDFLLICKSASIAFTLDLQFRAYCRKRSHSPEKLLLFLKSFTTHKHTRNRNASAASDLTNILKLLNMFLLDYSQKEANWRLLYTLSVLMIDSIKPLIIRFSKILDLCAQNNCLRNSWIPDHNLLILFQVTRLTPVFCCTHSKICVKEISNWKKHLILFVVLLQWGFCNY